MTRFDLERLRTAVGAAVETEGLRPFARRSGVALGAIRSLLDGRDSSISSVVALTDVLGIPLAYYSDPLAPILDAQRAAFQSISGASEDALSRILHGQQTVALTVADFAWIPHYDAQLSAGPGVENGEVAIVSQMIWRLDWLRKIDVKPENAIIARVSGDSMAPCIQSGDMVMIDTSRREVPAFRKPRPTSELPVFAFSKDGEARVKRLEHRAREKLLVLHSDNRDVPPEIIAEHDADLLNILGRVVWSGHTWIND